MTNEPNKYAEALDEIFKTMCHTQEFPSGKETYQGRITLEQYNLIREALTRAQNRAQAEPQDAAGRGDPVSLYRQGKEAANYLIRELNYSDMDSPNGHSGGGAAHAELLDVLDKLARAAQNPVKAVVKRDTEPTLADLDFIKKYDTAMNYLNTKPDRDPERLIALETIIQAAAKYRSIMAEKLVDYLELTEGK